MEAGGPRRASPGKGGAQNRRRATRRPGPRFAGNGGHQIRPSIDRQAVTGRGLDRDATFLAGGDRVSGPGGMAIGDRDVAISGVPDSKSRGPTQGTGPSSVMEWDATV